MYITVSALASAINEKRHIRPEELTMDPGLFSYDIQFVNSYGHIEKDIFIECKTDKAALQVAKKEKFMYPECYIEILNLTTGKRIYA